jgi:hypothetical protein
MPDIVLPSKLIPEQVTIEFEFGSELEWLETIVASQVVVEVYSGIDPDPGFVLRGPSSIIGTVVSQRVKEGLPGVIYLLICTAEGSTGQFYQRTGVLAILPSAAFTPPLFGNPFTSRPYAVEVEDAMGDASAPIIFGRLFQYFPIVEGINNLGALVSGDLRPVLIIYVMRPEGIDSIGSLLSGVLATVLITYVIRPEGINSSANLLSGALITALIVYPNYQPEGITDSGALLSGILA